MKTYSIVESAGESWQVTTIDGQWCGKLPRNKANNPLLLPPWFDAGNQPDDYPSPPQALVGKLILLDVTAPASLPSGKKRGDDLEQPVVDAEAMTATWYTLVDMDSGEIAAKLAEELVALKAAKKTAIEEERDRLVFTPIAAIDVRGDGSLMVEPDIRHKGDRDNLGDLHARALELHVAGVTAAVMTFIAADNSSPMLTPLEMLSVASSVFDRGSDLHSRARVMKTANTDAANAAGVASINVSTGAIDGVGAWPT